MCVCLFNAHVNCLLYSQKDHLLLFHLNIGHPYRETTIHNIRCSIMLISQASLTIAIDIMTSDCFEHKANDKTSACIFFRLIRETACIMNFITYHLFHNNLLPDNQLHIDILVDYFLVYDIHLHYDKQDLSMDLFVDHMLNLRNLDDTHIYMMHLH